MKRGKELIVIKSGMFSDLLQEEVCGWSRAMSVQLPLAVNVDSSWLCLLMQCARLSRHSLKSSFQDCEVVGQ